MPDRRSASLAAVDLDGIGRELRTRLDAKNAAREKALPLCRKATRLSANAIRAVHRSDDVHDELRAGVRADWRRSGRRSRRRGARAREMTPSEHEDDEKKERAGEEPPARRGEGIQHVANCDNKGVTRG